MRRPLLALAVVSLLLLPACQEQTTEESSPALASDTASAPAGSLDTAGAARPADTTGLAAAGRDSAMGGGNAPRSSANQGSVAPGNLAGIDTTGNGPASIPQGRYTTTDSGLKYYDLQEGTGASPNASDRVRVHYTGWLQSNGQKFDSSYDRGAPATFPLNRVIPGWTEGLQSMQVGGKRQLVVPSDLGYGQRGTPDGSIPPGATLVFEVELLGVES